MCVRAAHTYCGEEQPGQQQQQQKDGWCPHHVRLVFFVSVPRRSLGGLSAVTRSHSFSPAPFFHRVCSFPSSCLRPLHLISPRSLSSSPCCQPPPVLSTRSSSMALKDWAVCLTRRCLISDLYSGDQVLSCHQHGKQMSGCKTGGWFKCRKLLCLAGSSR